MHAPSIAVMAPLFVGDSDLFENEEKWDEFRRRLNRIKQTAIEKGINIAISTDVWWGLVEITRGTFDWSYYERLVGYIQEAGLRWVPILSTHQCGGNIGDDFNIPIPSWVWDLAEGHDLHYVDEGLDTRHERKRDRRSFDCVSVWATEIPAVQEAHDNFRRTFLEHFRTHIDIIDEVNVSLGPSGEARYPSYVKVKGTGYPNRGQLQCYSDLAIDSFRRFLSKKYHNNIEELNEAWRKDDPHFVKSEAFDDIHPVQDTAQFFGEEKHLSTPFGRDFFDWYHGSLREHAKRQINAMNKLMREEIPEFSDIPIGAKIPGVHWRMASDRLAELCAGLIKTRDHDRWGSDDIAYDHGYASLMNTFTECFSMGLDPSKFILHFTCLEMGNRDIDDEKRLCSSCAKNLVFWIGSAAQKRGITIKGENAVCLYTKKEWDRIWNVLFWSSYSGFTCLRLGDLFHHGALVHFEELITKGLTLEGRVPPSLSAATAHGMFATPSSSRSSVSPSPVPSSDGEGAAAFPESEEPPTSRRK